MRFPDRHDILLYVEGSPQLEGPVQKQIFQLMASNSVLREQVAELRKDLYEIDTQIPDFDFPESLQRDFRSLAQTWIKIKFERTSALPLFYKQREFWRLFAYLTLASILLVALVRAIFRH